MFRLDQILGEKKNVLYFNRILSLTDPFKSIFQPIHTHTHTHTHTHKGLIYLGLPPQCHIILIFKALSGQDLSYLGLNRHSRKGGGPGTRLY